MGILCCHTGDFIGSPFLFSLRTVFIPEGYGIKFVLYKVLNVSFSRNKYIQRERRKTHDLQINSIHS